VPKRGVDGYLVGYYITYVVFSVPLARAHETYRTRPSALSIAGLYPRAARYNKTLNFFPVDFLCN
jgi:hypothetical protein